MTLEEVVTEAEALPHAPVSEQLAWLERAAAVAEAAELDARAREGALSLRAALGAIVQWTQGDRGADSLAELDVIVRTLMARALFAFCTSLAEHYDALAHERGAGAAREACREVADAYRDVARAVRSGERVPERAKKRIAAVQRALTSLA